MKGHFENTKEVTPVTHPLKISTTSSPITQSSQGHGRPNDIAKFSTSKEKENDLFDDDDW